MVTTLALNLVCESKICDLMTGDSPGTRWEASGVLAKDGYCYVVFDDRTEVGRFADELHPNKENGLFGISRADFGFEGIAYNAAKQRFYLLVEARKHAGGTYRAQLIEYDNDFNYLKERPLDFAFKSDNKGFEAVAHVRHESQDYVLALCEGNKCQCGSKGRKPGGGRIQVFEKRKKRWAHSATISLPNILPFADYSGMSIDHGRVAVVSQVTSMLWVGQFDRDNWTWRDEGQLFEFPRFTDGEIQYGNIEGVSWLSPTQIVTVSDRRKKSTQPDKRLSEKDQSVHIFDIPS
jgi:hypothetical protein